MPFKYKVVDNIKAPPEMRGSLGIDRLYLNQFGAK